MSVSDNDLIFSTSVGDECGLPVDVMLYHSPFLSAQNTEKPCTVTEIFFGDFDKCFLFQNF